MKPFVCSVGGCTFILKYLQGYDLHTFTCKDEPKLNWSEKVVDGKAVTR